MLKACSPDTAKIVLVYFTIDINVHVLAQCIVNAYHEIIKTMTYDLEVYEASMIHAW